MATDIVSTLFGLPSLDGRELEEQSRTKDYNTGAQFGAAFINPYGDPNVANLEQKQFASQFSLGGAVARGVGGLFGMKTQDQRRAADIQGVLKSTQEEVGTQDPAVLYPAMAKKLADMGYGEEAFRVGQAGHQARLEQGKAVGDMAYKKATIEYNQLLGMNQQAAYESKLMEQRGQIATGALTQLEGTEDPAVADKIWNAALTGLKAKGLDVSSLADLPPTERAKALQGIIDSSENSATRTKAEIAQATLGMKQEQFKEKMVMEQTKNDLKAAIANLQAEMKREGIDAATQRALTAKVDTFGNQLRLLTIKEKNDAQARFSTAVGTKEFNKEVDAYIISDLGIKNKDDVKKARNEYNNLYLNYLGKRDENGLPVYDNVSASNLAKKDVEKLVGSKPKWFGLSSEPTFSGKSRVIKLD